MTQALLEDQSAEYVLFVTGTAAVPTGPDCARASASEAKRRGAGYLAPGEEQTQRGQAGNGSVH